MARELQKRLMNSIRGQVERCPSQAQHSSASLQLSGSALVSLAATVRLALAATVRGGNCQVSRTSQGHSSSANQRRQPRRIVAEPAGGGEMN